MAAYSRWALIRGWSLLSFHYFNLKCNSHQLYEVITSIDLYGLQLWDRSLNCREDDRKEAKQHDEYAIGTYLEANTGSELVGHVPMELSYLSYTFPRAYDDNEISVKVTGSRRLENGLVIPGTFKARTPRAISAKFEREYLATERTLRPHGHFSWNFEKNSNVVIKFSNNESY